MFKLLHRKPLTPAEIAAKRLKRLHNQGLCHKQQMGYRCHGRPGECE